MFGFTKKELYFVIATIFLISFATYANLQVSFRRSRDVERKGDLRAIYDALVAYQVDVASFPPSDEGKIVACLDGYDDQGVPQRRSCEWGWEGVTYYFEDGTIGKYIETLPTDPKHNEGRRYLYLSNGRHFQIYTSLEGVSEPEYNSAIVERNLSCGDKICNYGLADEVTPLEKSIEEYENELRIKNAKEKSVQGILPN